ncbi:metal ABC transporter substrate-binding protein [Thermovibrio ammonificans]|uniref:Periplasmic solute binding protein n=1 Tax=Thermovibrio ammonificans (strain DSM 15698 / JCM 12110 / HB-1) TaxID=648996 RepID=E8T401_THEA1|nr:metal ABC transporter substrate-binding protein [Thermovibrio ammonificans]ADU96211.1 periplasmic solute binding protein [Thermovibrio ammonificans HB-1]
MKRLLFLLLVFPLLLVSCFKGEKGKPLVTTTLPVWKSVAYYIGGTDFRYYSILKGGESPHGYEPKPSDYKKLKEASLVIIHGLGLDDWALKGIDRKKVLDLGALFAKKYPQIKRPDYHLWMNPVIMEDVYFEVAHRLTAFYPKRETYYTKRAEDYASMIEQLIGKMEGCFKESGAKAVVVYHPVWKPFFDTFGIKVIEIARSPEEQVTPERIREVVEEAKSLGAKLVVSESFSDRKVPELVAKEIGGRLLVLNPLPSDNYVSALAEWGEKICKGFKETR